jgi:hypothetical protein
MSEPSRPSSIDFNVVAPPLDTLLQALSNFMRREWPAKYRQCATASGVLCGVLATSWMTYNAVRFLCAERPDTLGRQPELAVAVPPMARTILDAVFLVVFMFEDLPRRIEWYYNAGMDEYQAEYDRHFQRYGSDLKWKPWFERQRLAINIAPAQLGFERRPRSSGTKPLHWPHPGAMLRPQKGGIHLLSDERRAILTYLNDWFYRQLSSASHLSLPGLIERAGHLLNLDDDARRLGVEKYRSDCMLNTLTLLLALISELEIELRFNLAERCKYLWVLLDVWGPAQEVYAFRYAQAL